MTSASFYIWLVSTGVLIVSLFLLWLVPRLMGRRRQMRGHKYEMLADREVRQRGVEGVRNTRFVFSR